MRVLVVAVGRVRTPLAEAVAEYEKRAARYWKLEVVEVSSGPRGGTRDQVRTGEAERLLARIPDGLEIVALTRPGTPMGSMELAGYLEGLGTRSAPGAAFVVGGAFGLGEAVISRARRELSLSSFTLPHEMARLVLAEQLYRAGTIVRGEPYHKG